jgi:hypothetical protein
MRPALCVSLASFLISLACQSAHPTSAVQQAPTTQAVGRGGKATADNWDDETHGSVSNIAKLSYVNKRCRGWALGDIDIDQTCLVVRTVGGELVVIPNSYVDEDIRDPMDKWLRRFYEIGGGPQK